MSRPPCPLPARRANRELAAGTAVVALLAVAAFFFGAGESERSESASRPDDRLEQLTIELAAAQPSPTLAAVVAEDDERFVAVLIELMRAMELSQLPSDGSVIAALQQLSGQSLEDWPDWVEWYAETDLVPPPGFRDWKGKLLGAIDSRFEEFFLGQPATIRVEEVVWGGVRVDGIPALDQPPQLPAGEIRYLSDSDLVFGVSINDDHRAYPLRIMDSHEMVNDVVGGIPVSLAYCTLCGAGVLYDGRLGDETYTFGSSGLLMRSNKLMYDRTTRTLWNQLTGRPVIGPLAIRDLELVRLPVAVTTWADWTGTHPDSLALDLDTGFDRDYDPGAAYAGYYAAPDTLFPAGPRSDLLRDKDRVYALLVDGQPVAYPIAALISDVVVNDVVGETALVLIAPQGELRGSGADRLSGVTVEWEAGAEVRAYEAGTHGFAPGPEMDTVVDESGVLWTVTEQALVSANGDELPRIGGHLAYWFGWFGYFPHTFVYGLEAP